MLTCNQVLDQQVLSKMKVFVCFAGNEANIISYMLSVQISENHQNVRLWRLCQDFKKILSEIVLVIFYFSTEYALLVFELLSLKTDLYQYIAVF
jgi:hypothetical protein